MAKRDDAPKTPREWALWVERRYEDQKTRERFAAQTREYLALADWQRRKANTPTLLAFASLAALREAARVEPVTASVAIGAWPKLERRRLLATVGSSEPTRPTPRVRRVNTTDARRDPLFPEGSLARELAVNWAGLCLAAEVKLSRCDGPRGEAEIREWTAKLRAHATGTESGNHGAAEEAWRMIGWFPKNLRPRIRQATTPKRRGKRVRVKQADGVNLYSVEDARKWWSSELPQTPAGG